MKKFLFVLLVLAAAITAGCVTSPQIPPGCSGLQTDEECAASLSTTPAPTGSNLVVKSEQVQATPMPTEAMVATSVQTIPVDAKITTPWYPLGEQTVNFFGINLQIMTGSTRPYEEYTSVLIIDSIALSKQHHGFAELVVNIRYRNKDTKQIYPTEPVGMSFTGGGVPSWRQAVGTDADPDNLEWQADFSLQNFSRGSKLND